MATYYVDVTTGNDGDDGLSEGNAWQTLHHAADNVGNDDIIYIKGSASYVVQDGANDCVMLIDDAGASAAPITWIGYTDSPGDNGIATLDAGTNTLASAVITSIGGGVFNVFHNLRFTGGSSHGFDGNNKADDDLVFVNCRFDNNGGWGLYADNYVTIMECTFDNNTSGGLTCDTGLKVAACVIHTNANYGLFCDTGYTFVEDCLFYNNSGTSCYLFSNSCASGCSIDGDAASGTKGIDQNGWASYNTYLINNILYDLAVGIEYYESDDYNNINAYNLFYSTNVPYVNAIETKGDVAGTEDPFTDSGARDYSLKASSEAEDAGTDAGTIV